MSMNSIEHKVLKVLREGIDSSTAVICSCSGGMDSVVLAALLHKLQPVIGYRLTILHIHHGPTGDSNQLDYRTKAAAFVEDCAKQRGLGFQCQKSAEVLSTEADQRDFRQGIYRRMVTESSRTWVALGHHARDLLETRVHRLIRGVGPQGLDSMQSFDDEARLMRPMLGLSYDDIVTYSTEESIQWVADPSNLQLDPFRNWLRHEWLPALEARSAGATATLARSLQSIVDTVSSSDVDFGDMDEGVSLPRYWQLGPSDQRRMIAMYMWQIGIKNYGLSHIEELRKRLDTGQKELTFSLLGYQWRLYSNRLSARSSRTFD